MWVTRNSFTPFNFTDNYMAVRSGLAGLGANLLETGQGLLKQYGPALKSVYAAYKGESLADPNENIVTVPASAVEPPPVQPKPASFFDSLPSWAPWAAVAGIAALVILPKLGRK